MKRRWTAIRTACMVLVVATLLFPMGALAANESGGTLMVTGRAELRVEPDMALFQVGVETRGKTVEEARQANAEAMDGVMRRLLEAGADERDLKTTSFNVHPEWHYNSDDGTRTLVGYRVSHMLEVRVMDLDQLGAWLDAAMEEGANQIHGPTFGIKDPAALEAAALTEAVNRARNKAEVIAKAGGVFLKGVANISEQVILPVSAPARASFVMMDAMEKAATSISPGEISVTATVTITYRI